MNNYDDIINLPHHVSSKHPKMSMQNRASQFAPFSALTGYDETIKEVARLTENKKEIDESVKEIINKKVALLKHYHRLYIKIEYFKKDQYKEGGKYLLEEGYIEKISDKYLIINNQKIRFDDIIDIQIDDYN